MRWRFVVAALLLGGGVASANGRPPATNGIHFGVNDDHSIYTATTFGLLVSHDDGCTFNWLCEDDIGYGGVFDPKYRIAADGTIFATTFKGVRASYDGGCSFQTVTSPIWFDAIDIGPTGEVWAGTAENGTLNNVFASRDNGATFEPRGLESKAVWYKSIVVPATDASRVYITGYQVAGTAPDGSQMQPTAHLFRSDDDGATWNESALAGVAYGTTPIIYVHAADPTNENVILVSSLGASPPNGDRLYRSEDGGLTLSEVLVTTQTIRDVVFTGNGHVVVADGTGGSFESSDGGKTFTQMAGAPELACVGQRSDGAIFGCGQNWDPDFKAVARQDSGASWQKVFRFVELAGPLDCPAGTAEHDACAPQWDSLKEQFGATGPTCGSHIEPPDAGSSGNGDKTPLKPGGGGGGCCDAGDAGPASLLGGLVVGGALLLSGRRRKLG